MKGTEHFKQAIKAYLDERAKTDELFAVSYAKENKNLDDCVTFILNQAMAICKEGGCGMTDDEVYSLGVHYYDEDDIKVSKQPATKAVVSNRPEKKKELIPSIEKTKPEQIANNKRKGKKKEIPSGQFLLFEDL